MTRIAVLDQERCRPDDCGRVCYRFCPMVRSRVEAIVFEPDNEKPHIIENLCSGCGICIKKCPFGAITIVNLPDEIEGTIIHRFGPNTFQLHRLPTPTAGKITGLIGKNGVGKTTVLRILTGDIKPNLGRYDNSPEWDEIVQYHRGSTLQSYFDDLSQGILKVAYKPQYVSRLPLAVKGRLVDLLQKVDEKNQLDRVIEDFELDNLLDRNLDVLSGGELQRAAIAATIMREADAYLFDEPSSYLDARQRLRISKSIRGLATEEKRVFVVEHDLAILDYLSDNVCVLFGEPGAYGIVSRPHSVRVGINIYLEGYLPDENVRFREQPIKFRSHPTTEGWASSETSVSWPKLTKTFDKFQLVAEAGEIFKGEVVGILGPNGIGKTTFIKILAGIEEPEEAENHPIEGGTVSYKPQYISGQYKGTVEDLLKTVAETDFGTSYFKTSILRPSGLERLLDRNVDELSGGELQKVAIAVCLSRKADIYLLDEPSAYLDVEERLSTARTIRRIVEARNANAFVVEHDVASQDFIADRLIIFKGSPGLKGTSTAPMPLRDGMNDFLRDIGITFRRDLTTQRPRVNKTGSRADRFQKEIEEYYYSTPTSG
ncbi:MAG: ribosome biogenesis/translation initiation ATPase RLI [Candidatus Bathyarchaeota archaeon]|nr:MAG: ribosome biogenesis/translation initiation ATPase RLI [Candidatus Bathyarchaeota archaeon]